MTGPSADQTRRGLGSRYELVQRIGQGAMGDVWQIWDRVAERYCAAKLLRPELVADVTVLARFLQERSILVGLDHPNIVRVHDLVVEGDSVAIIMDLVEGGSLGAHRRAVGTVAPAVAVPLAAAVLDALAFAHSAGVLHRDVKPDNILLATGGLPTPEAVRLSDFGIARLTQEGTVQSTSLIGTPLYMPPELFRHGQFSPKSDVYATGILLYDLLAGRTPFAGPGNQLTIGLRHVASLPPPLPLHPALWLALTGLLAKDPAHRPSAAEAAARLRNLPPAALGVNALPVQADPDKWGEASSVLPGDSTGHGESGRGQARPGREGYERAETEAPDDPLATHLRPGGPAKAAAPVPAEPTPDPEADFDPNRTRVKADAPHDIHLVLPQAAPRAAHPKRKWFIVGGAAAAALVTAVVLFASGVFSADGEPPAPVVTAAPAHVRGSPWPSGLEVDLEASWDAQAAVTKLAVTLTAPRSTGLKGDVLIVVPPPGSAGADADDAGRTCPNVTAGVGTAFEPIKASADGALIECGHKFPAVALTAGARTAIALSVAAAPDDFAAWLEAITDATLDGLGQLAGTTFPLQRIKDLTVEADRVALTPGGTTVPYKVHVGWLNQDTALPGYELFRSDTMPAMVTDPLLAVTGGAGLDGVTVTVCPEAETANGFHVVANQPTSACALKVQVGELTATGSFGIDMTGS